MKRLLVTALVAVIAVLATTLVACGGRQRARAASIAIPTHIATWAFDDNCNGGIGASASLVRRWVSYADSDCGGNTKKARRDCHRRGVSYCTAIAYLNSILIYSNRPPVDRSARESWWLHQPGHSDAAHRLAFGGPFGTGYMLNQSNRSVDAWFRKYVRRNLNSFDGLMLDDTAASPSDQFYGSGFSSSAEIRSVRSILAEHRDMAAALTHRNGQPFLEVNNGLSVNPYLRPEFPLLNDPSNVVGLVAESDPISDGTLVSYYSTLLDDMAYVDHTANDFLVLLSYDQWGWDVARRIQAATVLLGYSPGHTVSWSELDQHSTDLAIWPEEGIYPTNPVQSMGAPGGRGCLTGSGHVCSIGGHRSLEVAPGVYRREFQMCYDRGVAFGSCAVVMNDTGGTVTVRSSWLKLHYGHQITMIGREVQAGGRIDVRGAPFSAGSTTIAPQDAILISS